MEVIKQLVPESKWSVKCPYQMNPRFVVVHNTANDASARNEIAYMIGNSDTTSYHYAVDDKEIVQGVLESRTAWHAGDGTGRGNMYGIGIEICYSLSGGSKFEKAEDNAADLIADILKRYGWGIEKVTKHQDYSGKYCPHRTLDLGWERFLKKIKDRIGGLDMTQYEELKGLLQGIEKRLAVMENKMIYHYIDENMPSWARPTIQKLVDLGLLQGDGEGKLGLTEEMLRIYVINDRAGLYN
ncbi:MAG: hypothetical protein E7399_03090 [Ruminococcaceae bacterium]|nr:hypothetical protein [Oscillospiraceae bacterium]